MEEKIYHCQICAKPVKAGKGLIAHHGYKRPYKQGWQTGSCVGARFQPYEVSCDRIPYAILLAQNFIKTTTAAYEADIKDPPAKLRVQKNRSGWNSEYIEVPRPEGFDAVKSMASSGLSFHSQKYEIEFNSIQRMRKAQMEAAKRDLEFFQERLANWKPAAAGVVVHG